MAVELKVPSFGESVTEAQVGTWFKKEGDFVEMDEAIVELESDKATQELYAPSAGRVTKLLFKSGDTIKVGEVLATIDETAAPSAGGAKADAVEEAVIQPDAAVKAAAGSVAPAEDPRGGKGSRAADDKPASSSKGSGTGSNGKQPEVMPSARRALAEKGMSAEQVQGTGRGGRVLKEDVLRSEERRGAEKEGATRVHQVEAREPGEREELVPMSPIRRKIAERLVESQQTMALLTTFNEIDMSEVMALRKQYQDKFVERYGHKLGFMSFFVKAAIYALKQFPQLNAEISGTSVIYKNYYDIGVAIGGGKGLVVPVVRDADRLSFSEIELTIADFAERAQKNKLAIDEFTGGTFTVSNGGVYGSLMSTPIINPPQTGILGLHAIQDRPVARDGQVVIRPMMYVALTYDHRIVDGRESVTFLKRIKDAIEDPSRMLLEV
jgi:2-oxoglutarate dehydrogenase E2 component (dihydrolipoamide succinyltransferase)